MPPSPWCRTPEFLRGGRRHQRLHAPRPRCDRHAGCARPGRDARAVPPLVANNTPIVFTERRGAELIKYAANAFLATKITFINEIADLCEQAGANVQEVAQGIGLDNRIGPKFLNAGPGYGGSCFPKDLLALLRTGLDFGVPIRSIETIISINEQRKRAMARKVIALCGGSVRGSTIAVLGLTFKPDTDDMREAPSVAIINRATGCRRPHSRVRPRRHEARASPSG